MSPTVRTALSDPASQVTVSAASVWEIVTKARIGKLPAVLQVGEGLERYARSRFFDGLPVSLAHGQRAGSLPGEHHDAVGRMLNARALEEDLVLVSNETIFDAFGVRRLW